MDFKNLNVRDLIKKEFLRNGALIAIACLAIIPMWDATQVVFYFIGATALFGIGVHFIRKALFPYIDLREYLEKAKKDSLASSIVFFSVTLFICTVFYCATHMIGVR